MKIVVVGATGNLGTALLERLQSEPEVTELVGVSRRRPDDTASPYAGVTWHSLDIGLGDAPTRLAPIFAGADAVVHLAWALQPNHDEPAMWKTNVTGTAAVLQAAADAGVRHILTASSVGAYSPGPKHRRVSETWPTGGIHTSHYSRHKAANERALDAFEEAHPTILVTRMRPGLVFQRRAATEIKGLFIGQRIPTRWLAAVRPPVIPLPSQTIFQAVHASDVADAFWRAIDRGASGAFNLAAEPLLDPPTIAHAIGAARNIPISARAARLLVGITWKLRLQPTDPGWIDIAVTVPIMATTNARDILGWAPTISATDALKEVVNGMGDHARLGASPSLRG